MVALDTIEVNLHDSQALIQIVNANITIAAWQRAGGKTGGGIGPRLVHLSEVMPRSQILLFSDTYERLMDRIVPNITEFLTNKLGLIEGEDYVKYKKPPDNWDKPNVPLDKYDKVISFATGMALCLVSLRVEGSANAFNAQAAIGDEVKYCDETKINTEVLPALRGAIEKFGHLPEYMSVWMFTDKFGPKIKWVLKKKKLMNQRAIDAIIHLQLIAFRLEKEMLTLKERNNPKAYYETKIEHDRVVSKANEIRKIVLYYSDMKPYENKKTVGERYFRTQRRNCKSQFEYNVSILNHDPDKAEFCYYPSLTSRRKYQVQDRADYNPTLPFFVAADYNFKIFPLPVAQHDYLPNSMNKTFNMVDSIFTLYPDGMEDGIALLCEKYKDHQKKVVHYIYDHTAIARNPLKTTYFSEFIRMFEVRGWHVIPHYIGSAPDHDIKFEIIKRILETEGDNAVMFNEIEAAQLLVSMENTPAKLSKGKTEKDKSSETNPDWPPEDSTHFGDAFDMLVYGVYELDLLNYNSSNDTGIMIQ